MAMQNIKWLPRVIAASLCVFSLVFVAMVSLQEADAVQQCHCGSFEILRYSESGAYIVAQVFGAIPLAAGFIVLSLIYPSLGLLAFGGTWAVLGYIRAHTFQAASNVYEKLLRSEGYTMIILGIALIVAAAVFLAWVLERFQGIAILSVALTAIVAGMALVVVQTPCDPGSFASLKAQTIAYKGQEYPLYIIPVADGVRTLALIKPGRASSTFIDPQNLNAPPIEFSGNWRALEPVTTFDFRHNIICPINPNK